MPSSGQGGPCCHCGRTNSCCWRRGPASKPILCNACGSRYLVKRSLDGYQPLQTRREASAKQQEAGTKPAPAGAGRRNPHAAAGRVTKPKRTAAKRIDSDAWSSEPEQSDASDAPSLVYMTDDSAACRRAPVRTAAAGAAVAAQRVQQAAAAAAALPAAAASRLKLSYITTHSQLQALGSANLGSIAGAFFASSLRLKPRKPVVVTVSAVW